MTFSVFVTVFTLVKLDNYENQVILLYGAASFLYH